MQLHVKNSPFEQEQVDLLNRLLSDVSAKQCMWLCGYLAALANILEKKEQNGKSVPTELASPAVKQEVTIIYGSQTGNGQTLAQKFAEQLRVLGISVTLRSMDEFKPQTLKTIKHLLIIVSTHGEGDPPDNAIRFYEFIHGNRVPKLEQLNYAVLALGDRSYEFFCETGKQIDERLAQLGATRLCPRVDCDVDFDESANKWFAEVVSVLQAPVKSTITNHISIDTLTGSSDSIYSKANPYPAEVLENINLNGRGSEKETRHLELSIEGSNFIYEPGDSIGIFPENDPELVQNLIQVMGWKADERLSINHETRSLQEALLRYFEITVLTKSLLTQLAQLVDNDQLNGLLKPENEKELKEYIRNHDLLDLVRDFSLTTLPAHELTSLLRKMPARLYSIASSYLVNPDEVHLTIGALRYQAGGRERKGVCSTYCAERVKVGDRLPIYLHKNPNFKLPTNPDTPIIMIGAGTGIAPYRSFLEEREVSGAKGKSWLFFGNQRYMTDFLYQVEWQRWVKEGVLTKLALAFSRDSSEKIYVQQRMLENSKELFTWLEDGAVIYVCGDEQRMAKDVHSTLLQIVEQEGRLSREEAQAYISKLQQEKRYQRDVY